MCSRARKSAFVQVNHQLNIENDEKIRSSVSNDVIEQAPACPLMSIRANKRDEYVPFLLLIFFHSSSSFSPSCWSNKFFFFFSDGMDLSYLNLLTFLSLFIINVSSLISSTEFQCLFCDNLIDGPGCGEFTRTIPLRTCRTYCYFAIIYNRSSISQRAIRDCSPYDDMSVDGTLLLEDKLGHRTSTIDILTLKRCNSEQCNNDFYLKSDEYLLINRTSTLSSSSFVWTFQLVSLVLFLQYFLFDKYRWFSFLSFSAKKANDFGFFHFNLHFRSFDSFRYR